mmetsp:Transcript_5140/g.9035  ORF Transcript_5140/g.9035 Transcript_5140/m.9035 type:complete len:430 (-) Transcript_5140:329-1618(-)
MGPQSVHRAHQPVDHPRIVDRRGSEAQTLRPPGHGGIVDRLRVDAEIGQQRVGNRLGVHGIADHDRNDMAAVIDHRQAHALQAQLQHGGAFLMQVAQRLIGLQMPDRGSRPRRHGGRDRGGEDETGRVAAHRVTHLFRSGDIAAMDTEGLAERAVDDVDAVHQAVALRHPCPARTVEADSMDFIQVGQRAEFIGEVAQLCDRTEIAVHRIDRLKSDQLRRGGIIGLEQLAQMRHVVMAEDAFGAAIAPHALDHRGMVQRVGINDQAGEQLGQRGERGIIGNIGRGENQRRFLLVQVAQLGFQRLVVDGGARDVAGAARACAGGFQRFVHRFQNRRMLAHAEVIVAAPYGDLLLGAVRPFPDCVGELTLAPLDIDKGAIATFFVQLAQGSVERGIVVHWRSPVRGAYRLCRSMALTRDSRHGSDISRLAR